MREILQHISLKVKRKPNNMDQVMDIVELNKLNLLKKEVDKFGQQRKNLDCENKRLEHKVEILKDSSNVCDCITDSKPYSIGKDKIDQVISEALSKLAKKDIERFRSGSVKARLNNARSPSYLK